MLLHVLVAGLDDFGSLLLAAIVGDVVVLALVIRATEGTGLYAEASLAFVLQPELGIELGDLLLFILYLIYLVHHLIDLFSLVVDLLLVDERLPEREAQ